MNMIVMAAMLIAILVLSAQALRLAKKEDDEMADMKRRLERLENKTDGGENDVH